MNNFWVYKMFSCPICNDWIAFSKVCNDCDKIRQLCKLYGKEKLLEVLEKTMVMKQHRTVTEQPHEDEN